MMSRLIAKAVKIYSENNDFQHFAVLKNNRQKRHQYGEFFVEGVRNINEAIRNRWNIKSLIYSGEKSLSDWAVDILNDFKSGTRFELSDTLMAKLSDKEDTSELIAIVEIPVDDLKRIKAKDNFILVVFDRPANKGNLGTIIRSCDALGAQGLIITGHAVDLYDPETIRASMGSFFKLPVMRVPSFNSLSQWVGVLKTEYPAVRVAGTSEKGEIEIDKYDFTQPVVLLIGNESDGLSWNYEKMSDVLVRIPMSDSTSASSLNVACATSIFLYEIARQRRPLR
jgi:23S rRNA (uridine2479-2'-O)-methyltransferase